MFNREKLEKLYLLIIEWGIYVSLFAPLVFIRTYFFPFVVSKTIFFRTLVDIIFIAYILLAISNPKYRPRITPLTIAVTIFLVIIVLTSVLGVNFERSFWSTFERMTGLLSFFHLYAFYIVLTSVFKERKQWEVVLSVSILAAVFICLYALTATEAATRGGGTLGNTSFLSAYLLFNIFFALILLIVKSGLWRIFYAAALFIFLYAMFFNTEPTRGAIGGLVAGLFIMGFGFLFYYLFSSGKRTLRISALILIVLMVLGLFGFLQLDFTKEKIAQLWRSSSVQSRLLVWSMGWQGWQERFLFGWGQENFNIPFAKYYRPQLPLTYDVWYDRVHNIVLDMGVSSGIFGLLSYLSIFGVAIFGLMKTLSKVSEKKNTMLLFGMFAVLLSYFVQNIWVFDMISSYIMFFLALAFINFLISSTSSEESANPKTIPLPSFVGALLIIVAVLGLFFGNIQPARASRLTLYGISYPLEQSLNYFRQAMKTAPMTKFEVSEQISNKVTEASFQTTNQNKETVSEGFRFAEEELKNTVASAPLDFRSRLFLGRFYNNFYQFSGDTEKLKLAEEILTEAEKYSPNNQQVYWTLGQTKLFEGKKEESIELLKKAVELEPRVSQSHWYLALAYKIAEKYDLALAELKEAERLGFDWKTDQSNFNQVIDIYKGVGDNNMVFSLYQLGTELFSNNPQFWANLADNYAAIGEKEKAKEAAEKVKELKPELAPQIDEFLKELGY
ncbi:MAG: O-antigen ligase family protein [Candidatus Pacebacteria bacterium]|nr:O-antigen ligase family protein [Candidatus Paceibacterota bacterium]